MSTIWPSGQPDVDGAESKGPLEVGSVFRWQTAGLDITSTVERWLAPRLAGELQAHRRAALGGRERRIVALEMVRYQRSAPLLSKKPPVGPSAAISA